MLLLKQNITKKQQVNGNVRQINFNVGNNKDGKYKVKTIRNNIVYVKESLGHLLRLYYLVFWKDYLKKKISKSLIQQYNTLKSLLA